MIMKIMAWVLGILILVGIPVILQEWGLFWAGCFIVGYALGASWKSRGDDH